MRFLVIGLGSIGTRHAENLITMGHEVSSFDVAAYPSDGMKPVFDLQEAETDACLICSPTDTHAEYLHYALGRGWHTFVEKPLASECTDKLREDVEYAKDVGIKVMMGNMLRFHPNVKTAKSMITKPRDAHFQILQKNDRPDYKRDGVLLNWGAHEIDLALYLLGPAVVHDAKVKEDWAEVTLTHEHLAMSTITMDYLTEPEVRKFKIEEEDETLHEVDLTLHDWNQIYIDEMEAFVSAIEGKPWPGATGDDGLATLEIIDAAKRLARLS